MAEGAGGQRRGLRSPCYFTNVQTAAVHDSAYVPGRVRSDTEFTLEDGSFQNLVFTVVTLFLWPF